MPTIKKVLLLSGLTLGFWGLFATVLMAFLATPSVTVTALLIASITATVAGCVLLTSVAIAGLFTKQEN